MIMSAEKPNVEIVIETPSEPVTIMNAETVAARPLMGRRVRLRRC
jgi:hypothetical protein